MPPTTSSFTTKSATATDRTEGTTSRHSSQSQEPTSPTTSESINVHQDDNYAG